jgi:hypothetical protein
MDRLVGLVSGELTWRRFGVLVRGLPGTSNTKRALSNGDTVWGATEHLLAVLIDVCQIANWQRGGDKKIPKPEPFPRPGLTARVDERRTQLTPAEVTARLLEQQRRHRQEGGNGSRACNRLREPGAVGQGDH